MQGTDAQTQNQNLTMGEDDDSTTDGTGHNMVIDDAHSATPTARKRTRTNIGDIPDTDFHASFPDFTAKDPLTASIPEDVIARAKLELDRLLKTYMDDRIAIPNKERALNASLAHIKNDTLPSDLGLKLAVFTQWPKTTDKDLIASHDAECAVLWRAVKTDLLAVRYNTLKNDYTATCNRLRSDYTREKYIETLRLRYADISTDINLDPFFLKCSTDYNTKFALTEIEVRAQLTTKAERHAAHRASATASAAVAAPSAIPAPPLATLPAPPGLATAAASSGAPAAPILTEASLISLIRQVFRDEQKNVPSHSPRARSTGRGQQQQPSDSTLRSHHHDQRQPLRDSDPLPRRENRSRSPPRGNSNNRRSDDGYDSHRPFQSHSLNGGRGGTGRGYGRQNQKSSPYKN